MRITRIRVLGLIAAISAVLGWLVQRALTWSGMSRIDPQLALPIILVAAAVIVVILGIPIRRRLKGDPKPLNPFYATNVLMLAKSSALTGAVFFGASVGFLIFAFTLPVVVVDDSTWMTIATGVAGLVLSIAGLIVEHFCQLPPSDDDENADGSTPVVQA